MNPAEPTQKISSIKLAGNVLIGAGSLDRLGDAALKFAPKNALIVSDNMIKKVGILERVEEYLKKERITYDIFTEVDPDPTIECASNVAQTARQKDYSLIIGVGGGSSLDMAKIASAMITNRGEVSEYIGVELLKQKGAPLILIPTTSGTGSEVTANAIVSSRTDLMKKGIVSPYLFPDLAIVDPTLTISCPPKLTAYTGLDALSHNIEGFMALRSNPFSDALALKATEFVFKYLPLAFSEGSNLEARYYMALASLFGGMVIQGAGTCGGHAAAYAFAVKHNIPHGISCALVLPYFMAYNSKSCPEKIASIGYAVRETKDRSMNDAIGIAVKSVFDLMKKLGIPTSLKELGIQKDAVSDITKDIFKATRLLENNPRQLSEKDAADLFNRIWEGETGIISN
ncbi:iron-containing alcohol dehydrogenase [[Eubacterium] cellulosolvens]